MGYLGEEIKKLGFGLMRLPQKDGVIDVEQVKEMVDLFMEEGFTYFDTDERNYYLVNTSGNIQKNKLSGLKDGNDCYYYVNNQMNVVLYTDNKTLKSKDGKPVDKNDGKTFIEKYLNGSVDNN